MQRPPNYLTLYIWGPSAGQRAGHEASERDAKDENVIRVEGPPEYFAALQGLAQGIQGQYGQRLAATIREATRMK